MAPPRKKTKEEREFLRNRKTFQHRIANDLTHTVTFNKGGKVPARVSRLLADIFKGA